MAVDVIYLILCFAPVLKNALFSNVIKKEQSF